MRSLVGVTWVHVQGVGAVRLEGGGEAEVKHLQGRDTDDGWRRLFGHLGRGAHLCFCLVGCGKGIVEPSTPIACVARFWSRTSFRAVHSEPAAFCRCNTIPVRSTIKFENIGAKDFSDIL